jgi:hypothetical protein
LLQPLFGHLGSAGAAGLLLGLAALDRSATVLRVAAGVIVIVFVLVAAVPESAPAAVERALGLRVPKTAVLFGALGVVAAGLTVLVCRRAWGGTAGGRFLVAWLVVELLGYFALSPYPATRRIMGLVAVATILTCRVAAAAGRAHLLREVAVLNAALALLLFGADLNRCRGERVLAEQLAATANEGRTEQRTWMVANGAFEFYGARAGIEQLLQPGAQPKRGDRVLVVREFEPIFATLPMSARCVPVSVAEWSPELPLWSHYQFGTVAVARRDTPFTRVTVYRVR